MKKITGLAPPNPAYTVTAMDAKTETLAQAEALVKTLRDEFVAALWKVHNSADGGRDLVEAQFGEDSKELQAVGR